MTPATTSDLDDVKVRLLTGNERFVEKLWRSDEAALTASPDLRLAVVACMDTRYSVQRVLGLDHGHAKVVRTAGPALDEGVRRSLAVATHFLGVRYIAVLGHTDCGMARIGRGELDVPDSLVVDGRSPDEVRSWLRGFKDPVENVRRLCKEITKDPTVPEHVEVFGLIYDNASGRVRTVEPG